MRKIALTFIILLSAFTVASAVSAATKHRRAAQTNSPAYNAAAYGAGSGISYSTRVFTDRLALPDKTG
jgi:hypothetical protein